MASARRRRRSLSISLVDEFLKKHVLNVPPGNVKVGPSKTVELPAVMK